MRGKAHPPQSLSPFPQLVGRVAVLGGSETQKTQLLVGLALRQVRQKGVVLCLDGRQQRQTEVQFRLLLRSGQSYISIPSPGEIPPEIERTTLSLLSRGLSTLPPLLLLDGIVETPAWERTLAFLLKAGVVVVELLVEATRLVFGRYDTVLLLHAEQELTESYSRAVGRRVSPEEIQLLPAGEGLLIHLAQTYRVQLPDVQ
jgi:hypothetical protein